MTEQFKNDGSSVVTGVPNGAGQPNPVAPSPASQLGGTTEPPKKIEGGGCGNHGSCPTTREDH